jgi:hypothetical protein
MTHTNVSTQNSIAVFYEHPEWFIPLFDELDKRGIPYQRQLAHQHHFDPQLRQAQHALVLNRMSPSASTRGHQAGLDYGLAYLAYLKDIGANVINGFEAFSYELSKARQLNLLEGLGIRYPRTIVINHPSQALTAAENLEFPIVIKPNLGGSGAGIQDFHSKAELAEAIHSGEIDLGSQHISLLQEYLPARGNSIVRVEILNGEFLYAIRLKLTEGDFNLCPADYCLPGEEGYDQSTSMVEGFTPPADIIEAVERITQAAHIDVGGVEYLINDHDGQAYFYDINTLSNFVADASNVIGFDPFPRLVDFMLERAGLQLSSPV